MAGSSTEDRVVIVGGCGIDVQGRASQQSGDSVPGAVGYSVGGVGRNIAENLARLDTQVSLISAVGADPFGEYVLRHTAESGVDTSGVIVVPDQPTGSYLSVLNETGEMVHAVSHMDVVCALSDDVDWIAPMIATARMIVIDTNLSQETIVAIAALCRPDTWLCADPVSTTKALRLLPILGRINTITPNRIEAEALCAAHTGRGVTPAAEPAGISTDVERLAQSLQESGIDDVIITLSSEGVYRQSSTDHTYYPPLPVRPSENVTGAGDGFMAGVVYGYLHNYDNRQTIGAGFAVAALTMASPAAVNSDLNRQTLHRLCSRY